MLNEDALELPALPNVRVTFTASGLAVSGTIAGKQPHNTLAAFFRAVHEQALALKLPRLAVDVRGLTFVTSSAIRLFIDWAIWISQPSAGGYQLCFVRNPQINWQRLSFPPLAQLARHHLVIEDGV